MKPAIRVSYYLVLNAGPHTDTSDASDLLGITWEDKMTNEELFRIANFGHSLQN